MMIFFKLTDLYFFSKKKNDPVLLTYFNFKFILFSIILIFCKGHSLKTNAKAIIWNIVQ